VTEDVPGTQVIRFATFELDARSGELRKSGMKLKLGGQPFQVLAILLEKPGEVVTRDELQKRLWPETFVDVDHNLNTAINKIREVLGDSAESPRFVETVPRRGYRFIGELERPVGPIMESAVEPLVRVEPDRAVPGQLGCKSTAFGDTSELAGQFVVIDLGIVALVDRDAIQKNDLVQLCPGQRTSNDLCR
jgi:DNA-binding winged helix-turn-helix (wHTH) protein